MAKPYRTLDSEAVEKHLLAPSEDWGTAPLSPLSPRQQQAQILISILGDFVAGKPLSEPAWRKAMYCASGIFGQAQPHEDAW